MSSKSSTELLSTAAESFSTVQKLMDVSRKALPREEQKKLRKAVSEDAQKTREHLNGRRLKTSRETDHSAEEEACVIRLNEVLDDIESEDTEEIPREAAG